jgi:predicted nucleic acid-binding protein
VDANILFNLAFVGRLSLLGSLEDLVSRAPVEVLAEVVSEREQVERALREGHLGEAAFSDVAELALFVELRRSLGMGEAACLALAVHRGALVASDEKRAFHREAEPLLGPGRILNTPGLMLLSVRRALLTIEEADEIKHRLESKRFRMKLESFRELL